MTPPPLSSIPQFRITLPCDQCPFRTDTPMCLGSAANRVLEAVRRRDPFMCHKTTSLRGVPPNHPTARYCAGAMLYALSTRQEGLHMLLGERYGVWQREALGQDVPTFTTEAAFRAHHQPGEDG